MQTAYCLLCRPARTDLKAPHDALRFVKHAHYAHGVPATDLEETRLVRGESGCVTWLRPDGTPWLHVVRPKHCGSR